MAIEGTPNYSFTVPTHPQQPIYQFRSLDSRIYATSEGSQIPLKEFTVFLRQLSLQERETGILNIDCMVCPAASLEWQAEWRQLHIDIKTSLDAYTLQLTLPPMGERTALSQKIDLKRQECEELQQKISKLGQPQNTFTVHYEGVYGSEDARLSVEDGIVTVFYRQLTAEDKKRGVVIGCKLLLNINPDDWRIWNIGIREQLKQFEQSQENRNCLLEEATKSLALLEEECADLTNQLKDLDTRLLLNQPNRCEQEHT